MHKKFDHKTIESEVQKNWQDSNIYSTSENSGKPKAYVLDMFPYPSGEGLHVGHPKGYIATDIYSRFKRMSGYEVLHPMGWDAFGLPAENFAIKNKIHPRIAVEKNVTRFKEQLAVLGFDYDWDREINTTDPNFYKWTQWIFIKLFEKGLAYESNEPINWCPQCQTGLANEDVESDGTCERCDTKVEKKPMRQWVLKIRSYADRMLEDLDTLEWPEHIKEAQRKWIGRSEGAEITFKLSTGDNMKVFTTRPDTLFGATYMVMAPEHELVLKNKEQVSNWSEVATYIESSKDKEEQDRLDATKEKTGVKLEGITAINPANKESIPVYIADYVLASYGTGAIMAVPAHDERDNEFAKKFGIEIRPVLCKPFIHEGEDAMRHDAETLIRDVVDVIIEHPNDGTFLVQRETLESGRVQTHFTGGGIDDNTEREALKREIIEETGFTDFNILGGPFASNSCEGYRHPKKKNQITKGSFYHVKLKSLRQISSEVEEGRHQIEWLSKDEVTEHLNWSGHQFGWEVFTNQLIFSGDGKLIYSEEFSGMDSQEAKVAITKKVGGEMKTTYKLRDWVFSRQRYWGEPIPIVHCKACGPVAVPLDQLPLRLPEVENYEPSGNGESPLANIDEWVNTECPKCNGEAKRETNTMPQWAGSSWYYLRFMDPNNKDALVSKEKEKYWAPVDVYVGGDHAVRHLIYARFWHKFLYDIDAVSTIEPFQRLEFLGFILAEDGRKMSKRWGNVINPDEVVERVGADTLRVYEMFMGPFENTIAWSTDGLVGARRFLERVNGLSDHLSENEAPKDLTTLLHKTIKKVADDIESFKFNTAISTLMIFINSAEKSGLNKNTYDIFLKLLAPFAPHITEHLWRKGSHKESVHIEEFPDFDPNLAKDESITIGVQINGKVRGSIEISPEATEEDAMAEVNGNSVLVAKLGDSKIDKVIYVKGRILNILISG